MAKENLKEFQERTKLLLEKNLIQLKQLDYLITMEIKKTYEDVIKTNENILKKSQKLKKNNTKIQKNADAIIKNTLTFIKSVEKLKEYQVITEN